MTILRWAAAAIICALLVAEIALRLSGVLDFPLFVPGPPYGYIPAPSQSGAFLGKNDWVFNEISMGTPRRFAPSVEAVDTLLVGDSIVSGGNPYKQHERLGPQLESLIGGQVWPISANSWSLANELTYIGAHSEVRAGIDRYIFTLNSSDFQEASIWRSELSHPTRRPILGLMYVARRKLGPPAFPEPQKIDLLPAWRTFSESTAKPIMIVAFPSRAESKSPALRERQLMKPLRRLRIGGVSIVDVGADPRWGPQLYRDEMHPNPQGTKVLAKMMAEHGT